MIMSSQWRAGGKIGLATWYITWSCILHCSTAVAFTCNATSPGTQNFGNVSPVAGLAASTTGTIGVTCTVGLLEGLVNGTHIKACLSIGGAIGSNPRLLVNGANTLQYNLYSDPTHTQIIGSAAAAPPNPVSIDFDLGILGILLGGSATQNVALYAYLPASQTAAPAGTYSQSFSGSNALLNYTSYVGAAPTCSVAWTNGGSFPFSVSATLTNDCNISASNIDFGASGVLGSALTANATVSAQCTTGDSYSISLDSGTTPGATITDRRMRSGGGAVVHYQLYTASNHSTIWGDGTSGTSAVGAVGTGSVQTYTVYGLVAAQATPAPGSYTDVITATITY
jgi:spore coat protein U-like protein